MNRIFIIFVLLICVSTLHADYFNPPQWQSSRDYTHQSWDFGHDKNDEPNIPAKPDGEPTWINSFSDTDIHDYNTPRLKAVDYANEFLAFWMYVPRGGLSSTRVGVYGGMTDTTLTFYVPDGGQCEYWQRRLWIQMTYFARSDDGAKNYDIQLARDAGFTDTQGVTTICETVVDACEPTGDTGRWYRFTGIYKFDEQPVQEYIKLTVFQLPPSSSYPVGGAAMIDQVDIDCRSVNVADLNENDVVDMIDFALFANQWRQSGQNLSADFDNSQSVDFNDLAVLAINWQSGF
ncbi:MAG: hypothetical protein LLF92_05395 [Planctomycetaceae bacterium]|nr:hypothetical protein [Planctomycetaceae bacterium]